MIKNCKFFYKFTVAKLLNFRGGPLSAINCKFIYNFDSADLLRFQG
jgi:hypothetical protein